MLNVVVDVEKKSRGAKGGESTRGVVQPKEWKVVLVV
jgi:hypothetical protein